MSCLVDPIAIVPEVFKLPVLALNCFFMLDSPVIKF